MENTVRFRVRYSEIDRMGTFYNSRALEWFEWGRVELLRVMGIPYAGMELAGFCLPLIEAHVEYLGRAEFDDLLALTARAAMCGKARVRFDMFAVRAAESSWRGRPVREYRGRPARTKLLKTADRMSAPLPAAEPLPDGMVVASAAGPGEGKPVLRGHTIHAVTDRAGRPTRPPECLVAAMTPR